ncbi:MAG: hypothetical protein JWQ21_187 [Herminiimonas sp.]|nr:hypothetical protein [Herminiimonas sp.]
MRNFINRTATVAVKTAVIVFATACQSAPADNASHEPVLQPVAGTVASRQLIIKFKPGTIACDPAGIARLSAAARVPLEFVRTMSGNACVVKQLADPAVGFPQGEKMLKQHPAIEWIEPDEVMKTS